MSVFVIFIKIVHENFLHQTKMFVKFSNIIGKMNTFLIKGIFFFFIVIIKYLDFCFTHFYTYSTCLGDVKPFICEEFFFFQFLVIE